MWAGSLPTEYYRAGRPIVLYLWSMQGDWARAERPGIGDGQGDPGGGLPHPARRGGGDDTEAAGGERAGGARGRAVAGDVLTGGVLWSMIRSLWAKIFRLL